MVMAILALPRAAILLFAALPAVAPAAPDVLRTAAEIESLPGTAESRGLRFELDAVFDCPADASPAGVFTFIVHDSSGGTMLQNRTSQSNVEMRPGDTIRATGEIAVDSGEIYADCHAVEVLSHGPCPPPGTATVRELLDGRCDYRLVTVSGMVDDTFPDEIDRDYIYLALAGGGEKIYAAVRRATHPEFEGGDLIGAEVAITGRCFVQGTGWRRRIGRVFKVWGKDAVRILRRPVGSVFDAPLLEDCRTKRPQEVDALGRRRIIGSVIAVCGGGQILLRTADGTVSRVECVTEVLPAYGNRIEASGFPESDLYNINLTHARWRTLPGAEAEQDPPVDVDIKTLVTDKHDRSRLSAGYHGQAIRIRGIVRSVPDTANPNKMAYVENGRYMIPVDFNSCPAACAGLMPGCEAEISGTCVMAAGNWRRNAVFPQIHDVFIAVRTDGDVKVVARPPWWTPARLMVVMAALVATILAVLAWNRSLRSLAERRGRELTEETISRVKSEIKVGERTRLSVELHDTIAQYLTGAMMEIRAGLRLGGAMPLNASEHLDLAQKTLESCRHELRNCLWDLRNRALEQPDMDAAIRQTIAPHVRGVDVAVRFDVPREIISDGTAHAILRIVRELALNAVRHGRATAIKIAGCVDGGRMVFSVRDNGCGFDPESAVGVAEGHFGLQGIRERIAAENGDVRIESEPGKGTRVSVSVKMRDDGQTS